jgi:hypothetical protein
MEELKKWMQLGESPVYREFVEEIQQLDVSEEEKLRLRFHLTEGIAKILRDFDNQQRQALIQEMNGSWLQRSWRPIIMLSFGAIIICGVFRPVEFLGDHSPFWELLEIGLGGYVIGRSTEKVAHSLKQNLGVKMENKSTH